MVTERPWLIAWFSCNSNLAARTSRKNEADVRTERHFYVGLVFTLSFLVGIPGFTLYICVRPAMNRTLLLRITPGMSREQVSTLLGPPNDTDGSGQWEYWRWGNPGWVEIAFDDQDTVVEVNDESVFP